MPRAQCFAPVKSMLTCAGVQELRTLVGIDVDPAALELATGRLEAQKPPATQLHLLPGNVRCAQSSASGCQCAVQLTGPAVRRHLLCCLAAPSVDAAGAAAAWWVSPMQAWLRLDMQPLV